MNDCKYKRKKKNILKGYFWCDKKKKVYKDPCYHCYGQCYRPKFPKSIFFWLKELFGK